MESNELKILWQTLAKEKLIKKELAEENIERIISIQSKNIIKKLEIKAKRNGLINVLAFVFTLIATIVVQIHINKLFPAGTYIGIIVIEVFLLSGILSEFTKYHFFKSSYSTESINDSLIKIKNYLQRMLKIDFIIGFVFCYCMLIIYVTKYLIDIGGFGQIKLYGNTFIIQSPFFAIFIIILLLVTPWWAKKNIKIKFSKIQADIDKSLKELQEQ